MVIIAGPNGAGKTTLQRTTEELSSLPFVNADDIAKQYSTIGPSQTRAAQDAAQEEIKKHLSSKTSFCFETVFSHSAKLDLIREAKKNGFAVHLFVVANDNPDINVARVKNRFASGGHDVPETKIRERRPRTLDNLKKAVGMVDRFSIIDTSNGGTKEIARKVEHKAVQIYSNPLPEWAAEMIADLLPKK